jgi:hypothetical protein
MEIKNVADNLRKFKIVLTQFFYILFILYIGILL